MDIDVVTFGKAMRDLILEVDSPINEKKEQKEKVLVKSFFPEVGGGALNTAVSLVKLGFQTSPSVTVGSDPEGEEIRDRLEDRGVGTQMVVEIDDQPTGTSVIVEDQKKNHLAYVAPGANKLLDLDMIRWKMAQEASFWYLLSLGNSDPAILKEIAKRKEKLNIRLAFNPGQAQLERGLDALKKVLEVTDILFVNEREAKSLIGKEGKEIAKEELLKKLVGLGPKIAVITYGKQGAACYGGSKVISGKTFPVDKVSTLGAGDAFGSAFLAGFMESGDLETALSWGIINSGHVLTDFGAQKGLLTKGELVSKLNKKGVEIEKSNI